MEFSKVIGNARFGDSATSDFGKRKSAFDRLVEELENIPVSHSYILLFWVNALATLLVFNFIRLALGRFCHIGDLCSSLPHQGEPPISKRTCD